MAAPGSGQLVKGEARLFDRIIGKVVSDDCELVPGGTHTHPAVSEVARLGSIELICRGQGLEQVK